MGKQVRFYALDEDEILFWDFIRSIPGSFILRKRSSMSSLSGFIIPWDRIAPHPNFEQYYIAVGNPNLLKNHIRKSSTKRYSEEVMDYVETGEISYCLVDKAPIIEYSSSFIRKEGTLAQGRIWADFYRLENHEFVYKGEEFENLYETLAKWLRSKYKKLKGEDGYFGKEALAWYEKGGKLS